MITITDQTGQKINLSYYPQKIISVVPSQTELLYSLSLNTETIGITKFCIHPDEWFRKKTRIGGTKTLDTHLIEHLNPDLIIANKEENEYSQIELLQKHFPVYISDIKTLEDAFQMITDVGQLTNRLYEAKNLTQKIRNAFNTFQPNWHGINTCYLIWQKPYMAAGSDTFISDMMSRCGFKNILAHKIRYPEITLEEIMALNCELLLLSSEPFPFKEKHIAEINATGFKGEIMLVDGEMFSWYGSRLLYAPEYFNSLLSSFRNIFS
ncbi:MAG: ABC transporter substrate-binding protein [Sphingobacteriales bacterium]|nr:ABC transporter substrate-binding protein [Sphingobacteriales bacterium]